MSICSMCKIEKPLEDFYPRAGIKRGRTYACKKCLNARNIELRLKDSTYPQKSRGYKRKELYGISPEQYTEMTKAGCEACGSFERLHIDHDHSCCPGRKTCGKCIKGILCSGCNFAEGHLQSDPARAFKLYEYMLRRVNGTKR